jgi:hypothetical protein
MSIRELNSKLLEVLLLMKVLRGCSFSLDYCMRVTMS